LKKFSRQQREREERKKKEDERKISARNERTKKRKASERSQANKSKKWRQQCDKNAFEMHNDENICNICLQEYLSSDDENNPWVMCDCWMHIECVPLGVDTDNIDANEAFLCHECQQ
jgi:uncharacterized membrane-anchored protein